MPSALAVSSSTTIPSSTDSKDPSTTSKETTLDAGPDSRPVTSTWLPLTSAGVCMTPTAEPTPSTSATAAATSVLNGWKPGLRTR